MRTCRQAQPMRYSFSMSTEFSNFTSSVSSSISPSFMIRLLQYLSLPSPFFRYLLVSRDHYLQQEIGAPDSGSVGVELDQQLTIPFLYFLIGRRLLQSE